MQLFSVGDTIRNISGCEFSDGALTAIVKRVDIDKELYWLANNKYLGFKFAHAGYVKTNQAAAQVINAQAFKADAGKPRWSLLMSGCASAVAGVVRVLTFAVNPVSSGGKGYVPHSWKEVPNATERYKDALHRHLNKIELGETHDDESGELHWHHVATNALFLAEINKDTPNAISK